MSATLSRDLDGAVAAPRARSRLLRPALMLGGVAAVVAGSLAWWIQGGQVIGIDNAYVRADKLSLATDVSGIVAEVPVHEGQEVQRGQVLFRLDDKQFRIALSAAQANLDQTRLQLEAMKRDYERMQRDIAAKQATVAMDQARFDRANGLVGRGDISRQTFDDARFQLVVDQQGMESPGWPPRCNWRSSAATPRPTSRGCRPTSRRMRRWRRRSGSWTTRWCTRRWRGS